MNCEDRVHVGGEEVLLLVCNTRVLDEVDVLATLCHILPAHWIHADNPDHGLESLRLGHLVEELSHSLDEGCGEEAWLPVLHPHGEETAAGI